MVLFFGLSAHAGAVPMSFNVTTLLSRGMSLFFRFGTDLCLSVSTLAPS
jgi:hypothetical protein